MATARRDDGSVRVLLFGHGGCYNRGCEAIVRGTVGIVRRAFPNAYVTLATYDEAGDAVSARDLVDNIIAHWPARWSASWFKARSAQFVAPHREWRYWCEPMVRQLKETDVALSIGGDNYCYEEPLGYYEIDASARRLGVPVVLWGASLKHQSFSPRQREDLLNFALITVRERQSLEHLRNAGLDAVAHLVADPAFLVTPEPVDLTAVWPPGKGVVAMNASPLIGAMFGADRGRALVDAYVAAVRWVVNELGMGVLLVPHVTDAERGQAVGNDDWDTLAAIAAQAGAGASVTIAPRDWNVAQIKYALQQCQWGVACRTHATIGSWSVGTPAATVAYSTKGWGLSRDVFGTDAATVRAETISAESLLEALSFVRDNEAQLRARLAVAVPEMVTSAWDGAELLRNVVGRKAKGR